MGLDMALKKAPKMDTVEELRDWEALVYQMPFELMDKYLCELIYWRKCNAVHKWFVDNVQGGGDDCGSYIVTREHLEQLVETLQKVMESPSRAHKHLPTTEGFFFGSTEYDAYYKESVASTLVDVQKVLEETDFENYTVYYTSSW